MSKKKIAIITGITGQDGSYLAEFLLGKNYEVHGFKRRSSLFNTQRIDHLFKDRNIYESKNFFLHHADLTDSSSINYLLSKIKPDEVYNLAAQSHVAVSFEQPEYTANSDALGPLRILEAIKNLNLVKKTKYYQASTSELYGNSNEKFQREDTKFSPTSPYATAKLYAPWTTIHYREAYGIFAVNGILFNHESPRRGETFVSRKIVIGLTKIKLGVQDFMKIGNLDASRDWGHAKDYVEMMWKMLQLKKPEDFVIATGNAYTVREFINYACKYLSINIKWKGKGLKEYAINLANGKKIIVVDKKYFRPNEVHYLRGDSKKAQTKLKWKPKYNLKKIVKEMVDHEFYINKKNS